MRTWACRTNANIAARTLKISSFSRKKTGRGCVKQRATSVGLLSRGYASASAIKIVGDRYLLDAGSESPSLGEPATMLPSRAAGGTKFRR
jgi:hypothetical protein